MRDLRTKTSLKNYQNYYGVAFGTLDKKHGNHLDSRQKIVLFSIILHKSHT